jgi:hypothetical protein
MSLAPLAPFRFLYAAVELAMQRNRKRNLAATHDDVTAALPHAFEAVFA